MRQVFALTMIDYKNKKIWWHESDLVSSYYHHLRPIIDNIPEYELYLKWYIDFEDVTPRLDLVVVKPEESLLKDDENAVTLINGYVGIAMEFKFGGYSNEDLGKLSRFRKYGAYDRKPYYLGDNIKRVNKGNKPDYAFYFILDASVDDKERKKSIKTYEKLQKEYPLVEIVYEFI